MSASEPALELNGWKIFAHRLLLDQLEKLIETVEDEKRKSPETYRTSASFKVLAALFRLMFSTIPADPTRPDYRQGATLGRNNKHWLRAKFGNQRFRLFFRYGSTARIIIYVWVNDERTLRTYGSRTDAYAVFASMIESGHPPSALDDLLADARTESARLARILSATRHDL